jgi:hypothetical protein
MAATLSGSREVPAAPPLRAVLRPFLPLFVVDVLTGRLPIAAVPG